MNDTKKQRTTLEILEAYAETVLYECAISAQYTANLQVLFRIDDIVERMAEKSFAVHLPSNKNEGSTMIKKTVTEWIASQDASIKSLFTNNDIHRATLVLLQRNSISCTIDDKVVRITLDAAKGAEVMYAVDLLRYPLIIMERLQRSRSGALLNLEKDAPFLIEMSANLNKEAKELVEKCNMLASHNTVAV